VAVVGIIPQGLPQLQLPDVHALNWSSERWQGLLGSAALISLIGYVSTLSVAHQSQPGGGGFTPGNLASGVRQEFCRYLYPSANAYG